MTTPHDAVVQQVSNVYGLPFDILQAQMMTESSGDPWAFRFEPVFFREYIRDNPKAKGAQFGPLAACSFGLLQIMLETACEIGFGDRPERLFDPQIGLAWGAKYLRRCVDKTSDLHAALARYNGGGSAALAYADKVFKRAGRMT